MLMHLSAVYAFRYILAKLTAHVQLTIHWDTDSTADISSMSLCSVGWSKRRKCTQHV